MKGLLDLLSEYLTQKKQILGELKVLDERQNVMLQGNCTSEEIDQSMTDIDKVIDRVVQINNQFSSIYDELAEKLPPVRNQYASQLKEIAKINNEIADLEQQIGDLGNKNKTLLDRFLNREKGAIKQGRQTSKAAYGYYQNMNGMGLEQSHLWDSKH